MASGDEVGRSFDRVAPAADAEVVPEQQRWARRMTVILVVLGVGGITLVLLRRDQSHRKQLVNSLEAYVEPLNERLAAGHYLPAEWDPRGLRRQPLLSLEAYQRYDDALREFAQNRREPTMIAWDKSPRPMMLRSDGRAVAIYQDRRIHVVWLEEDEFRRRLQEQQECLQAAVRAATENLRRKRP